LPPILSFWALSSSDRHLRARFWLSLPLVRLPPVRGESKAILTTSCARSGAVEKTGGDTYGGREKAVTRESGFMGTSV
jgi:hypothetical protein